MTLRRLCNEINGPTTGAPNSSKKAALIFVLNREFLPGLRVLCYSMCVHRTLLDLPVILISEDKAILDDPLVALIADRSRIVTGADVAAFQNFSSRLVDERLKLDWIPKYTYLKWFMFDDYGFDQHIFLDADIVCLRPIDELVGIKTADLLGGPVFSRARFARKGRKLSSSQMDDSLISFSRKKRPPGQRLNTGVLVVNKRLLCDRFRQDLIAFSEKNEYSVEQAALRSYIRSMPDGTLDLISPLYNFNHDYLGRVSAQRRVDLLSQIKLLHFAGAGGKPWEKQTPTNLAEMVWFGYAIEAERFAVLNGT